MTSVARLLIHESAARPLSIVMAGQRAGPTQRRALARPKQCESGSASHETRSDATSSQASRERTATSLLRGALHTPDIPQREMHEEKCKRERKKYPSAPHERSKLRVTKSPVFVGENKMSERPTGSRMTDEERGFAEACPNLFMLPPQSVDDEIEDDRVSRNGCREREINKNATQSVAPSIHGQIYTKPRRNVDSEQH